MLRLLSLLLFCNVTAPLTAQLKWPVANNTMRPWTRWWWQGSAVNQKDLLLNLELFKDAGLGGVEITPIYGVHGEESRFIDYLSDDWIKALTFTLDEGHRLGLGIDLANGTGWPFGGPWVAHENASKTVYHKNFKLNGRQPAEKIAFNRPGFVRTANNKTIAIGDVREPLSSNKNQQALSIDQIQYGGNLPLVKLIAVGPGGATVDLTKKVDKSGDLGWTAPPGKWTLIGIFQGLHGKAVERAAPGGEGYAIDHFSAIATREYLRHFDTAFKNRAPRYLRAFFNDSYEVDDAKGQSDWTPAMFTEFLKRKGYDLSLHLPALFSQDSSTERAGILYDYRSVVDELLLENFTLTWKKWAASRHALVRNQSHGSPANTLDLYAAVDIPETEGNDILRFKFASSAGNVSGKQLVSAEAATWLNEHFLSNWSDVKKAVDLFFLGGINHIFFHGSAYSPQSAPWPGWLFYAAVHFQPTNPMWKEFHVLNNYITRLQSFLQTSKPDNDILVYYPITDVYAKTSGPLLQHFDGMENNFEHTPFKAVSEWMLENDYSFDFFSSRQLTGFKYDNAVVTGGNHYQVILVPGNDYLQPVELAEFIRLCKAGATVLFYAKLPAKVPGFADQTNRQRQLDSLYRQLRFKNDGTVRRATVGKGQVLLGNDLSSLLLAAKVRKESLRVNGISFIRKINQSGTMYLLSNTSGTRFHDWLSFESTVQSSSAALYNPVTRASGYLERTTDDIQLAGTPRITPTKQEDKPIIKKTVGAATAEANNSDTTAASYYLELEPGETVIVQLMKSKINHPAFIYFEPEGASKELTGKWITSFVSGGPALPSTFSSARPQLWTELNDTTNNNFSGTGRYTLTFSNPPEQPSHWRLSLGVVKETAEVILNGKSIGSLIGPDFSIMISAKDMLAENKLEVIVSNLMANRISYMDRNNVPWKIFYNTNMPARRKENSKDGLFNAASWKPLPSGLGGPVSLTPMRQVTSHTAR